MRKAEIMSLISSPDGKEAIVFLKEEEGDRAIPISIGDAEARAIMSQLNGQPFPRPITHDLMKTMLNELGASVSKVVVNDLQENTFFALITLERPGQPSVEIDARPSDAIAIALHYNAELFVEETVLDQAGVHGVTQAAIEQASEALKDRLKDMLEQFKKVAENLGKRIPSPAPEKKKNLTAAEKLQEDLDKAIKEERYEDAARIKNEIKTLKP